jgi:hypothetical protein
MMKRFVFILTAGFILLATSSLPAVDKVPKDSGSAEKKQDKKKQDSREYQPFIDKNNNGVDDRLESERRKKTKVEPKRETEKKQADDLNKYKSDSAKNKAKGDSSKTDSKKESDKRKK